MTESAENLQIAQSEVEAQSSDLERRQQIIREIESQRGTRVVTYFLSDRRGATANMADDAVRPMYDHLRAIGEGSKIDLFLYSVGGAMDAPWRIVSMIREFTNKFSVLVPYKAMSAATLVAIGADEIVMGSKGELGPVDPQLQFRRTSENGTASQESMSVEDIMSYVRFLREKVGLTDQGALREPIVKLAESLDPRVLGQINRVHSHIRTVARKMLGSHNAQKLDEQSVQVVIDTLTERTYQHGHAIGRAEATDIGLKVKKPTSAVEDLMWQLYLEYEQQCKLAEPIDYNVLMQLPDDEYREDLVMGLMESSNLAHIFAAKLVGKKRRQAPPQLNLNLNLSLQLPANLQPAQLPPAVQQQVQQLLQGFQQQAPALVQQELQNQSPVTGFNGAIIGGSWKLAV